MAQLTYSGSCIIRRLEDRTWWAGQEAGWTEDRNSAIVFQDLQDASNEIENNIEGSPGQFITIYWQNLVQYVE